jgi:hypothetical protein
LKNPDGKLVAPRPKYWTIDAVRSWLLENPIQGEADLQFLKLTVKHHIENCIAARSTAATEQESLGTNWTGNAPHLRLIHCVVDDSIKEDYRRRDIVQPGRMEVENRNSSVRPENVWEKISKLWNDVTFEPDTLIQERKIGREEKRLYDLKYHIKNKEWEYIKQETNDLSVLF